eukprot:9010353-Alexandrium_andersonii.AAC.1
MLQAIARLAVWRVADWNLRVRGFPTSDLVNSRYRRQNRNLCAIIAQSALSGAPGTSSRRRQQTHRH